MELFSVLLFAAFFVGAQCAKGAMSGHIASVVCFVTVLMTSHDVNGQTHDVAQLNRKLTIFKTSIDGDIVDIRLEIMELKMIVEQIVVGQMNASDGSIIGQGRPAGVNQKEITDLKDKLKAHENRINRLFSTVNEIKEENSAIKRTANISVEKKENEEGKHELIKNLKAELLQLNAGIAMKCDARVNALENKFEETLSVMMKGYKKLKAHVDVKVSVVDQMHDLSKSVISEQNKLSVRIDRADAKIVTLAGGANKLDGFSRAIGELKTRTDKCCTEVDYCAPNPCEHGTCVNGRTNYTCVCDPSHTGRNCTEVDHCAFNPCVFGSCFNGRTGYNCVCQQHYTGRNCSEVDYCAQNPCEHGTCVTGRTSYTCVCDPSHTGRNCTEVDHCAFKPCVFGSCFNRRTGYSCVCQQHYTGRNCSEIIEREKDCLELRTLTNVSGVYRVRPAGMIQDIEVYCDMATDGGGWTVFQRRVNGSVDFYQNFSSYENGFGNVHGEHWLGLKYIFAMTSNAKTELRTDLMAADGSTAYHVHPNFRLSAATNYTLHVDKGHGTAGVAGHDLSWHNGSRFSTYDTDDGDRCAQIWHGAWWFRNCALVHLNGRYVTPGPKNSFGIIYYSFKGYETLKEAKMMFKRV